MPRAVLSFTDNNLFYHKQSILLSEQSILLQNNQSYFENNQSYFENNTILPILQSYRYEVRKKLLLLLLILHLRFGISRYLSLVIYINFIFPHLLLNVIMTLLLLISKTFSDLLLQFILIIPEVLLVVIFSLLEKTHYNMEYVPFAIMV